MRVYLILAALIGVVLYVNSKFKQALAKASTTKGALDMEKDPVCGKYVAREAAIVKRVSDGARYYCSQTCASADS